MAQFIDFTAIVSEAWSRYDSSRVPVRIVDISAKVSTNHVYRLSFRDGSFIIGKLSYFGQFEHFVEDHTIINSLSNNLQAPFENVLARSLMKGNHLFVHRFINDIIDAWVVFYRPIEIKEKMPRRLDEKHIIMLAVEMANFHKACSTIRNTLPESSKTLVSDINHLIGSTDTEYGRFLHRLYIPEIRKHTTLFLENHDTLEADSLEKIPVFVDWNIGNFSITPDLKLFSRWDYDWFRISNRMMDFYFLSRVVSDIGDRTVFTYHITTLMEDRFILFLQAYHRVYPITTQEILFLKEAYRFFILNYVIKDGRYFFHEIFATKLRRDAFEIHLPSIDKVFDPEKLLKALKL